MPFNQWWSRRWFHFVHGRHLVYNACWEDPRIDRVALDLTGDDTLLALTSAGCNVLDYALLAPRRIYAVDVNPRQNALLELKLAGIQSLDFETFFAMFGRGHVAGYQRLYHDKLRPALSPQARAYWDSHAGYFSATDWPHTFYFRGTAGSFAYWAKQYTDYIARARDSIEALLAADSLDEQQEIYTTRLRQAIWTPFIRWLLARNATLSMVGNPWPSGYRSFMAHRPAVTMLSALASCRGAVSYGRCCPSQQAGSGWIWVGALPPIWNTAGNSCSSCNGSTL